MAAKVLLVEDDNNLREIYEARLLAEGYTIVTAQDGEQALVVAKAEMPDLIISDVMMPRVSGFEMLDILRNTDNLKDTKVIMLTALGQADDKTRASSLGADRYLVKSQVTLEDIVKAAHELLEGTPAPAVAVPVASPAAPAPAAANPAGAPSANPMTATSAPMPVSPAPVTPAPPLATPPADPMGTASPAFSPTVGATPVSAAPPAPAVPNTPPFNEPTSAMTAPTTSEEEATVDAQINNFVQSAPATTPVAAPASASAQDDAVLADAVEDLAEGAEKQPADSPTPVAGAPEPSTPAAPDQPMAPSTPMNPPATPTSISDNVPVANKKIIQPLGADSRPPIHELLAREEAKNAGAGLPPTDVMPPAPATTFSPSAAFAAPATPAAMPIPNTSAAQPTSKPNDLDPNSISL